MNRGFFGYDTALGVPLGWASVPFDHIDPFHNQAISGGINMQDFCDLALVVAANNRNRVTFLYIHLSPP
jgi:hypothetical protein